MPGGSGHGRTTLKRGFTALLATFGIMLVLPYAWAPVYSFPQPASFRGAHLFNPYAEIHGTWQRANLHAHGLAWFGLTDGQQPDAAVAQRYRDLGYDVPGVSDYQKIAAHQGVDTPPLYEHGYSVGKRHQLAIGARHVEWLDFPLWQAPSHQQYVIDRVKMGAALVALAHPTSRDAYTAEDLEKLTGYDLIEIANGPFVMADMWDAALSAGHPVWAIANDDTHDLDDARRRAASWTMIDAPTPGADDIVKALDAGRSYAVVRTGALEAAHVTLLDHLDVHGETVSVTLKGARATVHFVGQNGIERKVVKDTAEASYALTKADTYVRAVVESPQTMLYLNPVVRYDGRSLPHPAATVDVAATWTLRGSIAIGGCLAAVAYVRRRRLLPRRAAGPVLAAAKR